ncbi:MAG: hypothetical protein ABJF05_07700 [Paracoccaceae bacterium]
MVRSKRISSNSIYHDFEDAASDENVAFDDVFEELERWHQILKPHADELRGPKP